MPTVSRIQQSNVSWLSDLLRERLLGDGRSQRSNSLSNQNFQAKLTLQITRDPVLDRSTGHGFTLTTNAPLLVRDVAPGTCTHCLWLSCELCYCEGRCVLRKNRVRKFLRQRVKFRGEVEAEVRLRLALGLAVQKNVRWMDVNLKCACILTVLPLWVIHWNYIQKYLFVLQRQFKIDYFIYLKHI